MNGCVFYYEEAARVSLVFTEQSLLGLSTQLNRLSTQTEGFLSPFESYCVGVVFSPNVPSAYTEFDPSLGMMAGINPLNPMMPGLGMGPPPLSQDVPVIKEIIHCKSCTLFPPNPSKS